MPNIYLFSYCGGHGGDFLCRQISQDPNYYPSLYKETTDNFRWVNDNPFEKYDLNFKRITSELDKFTVSDLVKDSIDKEFSEKHLIVPSHNMTAVLPNLPRVKRIKTISTDEQAYFYYILLCIKAWCISYDLNKHHKDMIPRFDRFKEMHKNNPLLLEKIEYIQQRGHVYSWEMDAIYNGLINGIDIIKQHFPIYQKYLRLSLPDTANLNLDDMYKNPADNVNTWSKLLDMQTILNANVITEYHQKNIDLIESRFNKSIDQYLKINWLDQLAEYVSLVCPDHY
jgi:hypothetical protein